MANILIVTLSATCDSQQGLGPQRRCFFKLGDAGLLGSAHARLAVARAALARAHGANLERLRTLHGNFQPELATCAPAAYFRVDLTLCVLTWYC